MDVWESSVLEYLDVKLALLHNCALCKKELCIMCVDHGGKCSALWSVHRQDVRQHQTV